jgi:hypothetical protein
VLWLLLLLLPLLLLQFSGQGAGETVGTALLDGYGNTISVGHMGKWSWFWFSRAVSACTIGNGKELQAVFLLRHTMPCSCG